MFKGSKKYWEYIKIGCPECLLKEELKEINKNIDGHTDAIKKLSREKTSLSVLNKLMREKHRMTLRRDRISEQIKGLVEIIK